MSEESGELEATNVKRFALAGNATFTVENSATGGRYTYRVRLRRGDDGPHFVSVLTGPSNTEDYTFLGTIFPSGDFVVSKRSSIGCDAPSAKAFTWLWRRVSASAGEPDLRTVRVLHEGRCGRCGRALTVPESIETGLGPECARKMEG